LTACWASRPVSAARRCGSETAIAADRTWESAAAVGPCCLLASFEQPDGVVQRALGQPGIGGLEFFEGTRQQGVGLGRADVSPECLRGKAHEHDIGLELVDAGQRAEVLPGDPSQAMNSCPRMADLGVVRAIAKIGDACDRYRLQAPGGFDTYVCFQSARGAGAVADEQPVDERHAMLRPRLVQEEVQAVLAKPWDAPGRERLAVRARSGAIRRDDALHGRIARGYGVDRIDQGRATGARSPVVSRTRPALPPHPK